MGLSLLVGFSPDRAAEGKGSDTHTVIFVDVDGVLNVAPPYQFTGLHFDSEGVQRALRLAKTAPNRLKKDKRAQVLYAIGSRRLGHGEAGTFATLASDSPLHLSAPLVRRLLRIVLAGGPKRSVSVVLSAECRRAQDKIKLLEWHMSHAMLSNFRFDGHTPLRDDTTAPERLKCIADFAASFEVPPPATKLKLLVLDDFFATPLEGWSCNRSRIDCAEAAEEYILRRCEQRAQAVDVEVKVVHTFEEWTKCGHKVWVGAGLTNRHYRKAMDWLEAHRRLAREAAAAPTTPEHCIDDECCFSWLSSAVSAARRLIGV